MPIVPPPPARLSITMGWPSFSDMRAVTARTTASSGPPAA